MSKSLVKSVLKLSSSAALAAMTVIGVGAIDVSASTGRTGEKVSAPNSDSLKLACHNREHYCQPTCGVRG